MSDLIYKHILLFLLKGEMSTDENEVDKSLLCAKEHMLYDQEQNTCPLWKSSSTAA